MKTYGGKQFNAVVVDPTAEDQKVKWTRRIVSCYITQCMLIQGWQ
jgi:hypothetical protein